MDVIGISAPSFYFAFGSKEGLFRKVLDRYISGHLRYIAKALDEPTAQAVAKRLLYGFADGLTHPRCPPGCLSVNCALPCVSDPDPVRLELARMRDIMRAKLSKRFKDAIEQGDLPADADAAALARFLMVVGMGRAGRRSVGREPPPGPRGRSDGSQRVAGFARECFGVR